MAKNKTSFKRGHHGFWKDKHHSDDYKIKMREVCREDKCYKWKGDKVGYSALHKWIRNWKGKADHCEMCGDDKKYENKRHYQWANIDHTYRRILDDYISLCIKCHKKYDKKFKNK